MLKPRSPQASFYGSYLYDKIVPVDHLLRRINQVVDFSFVNELVKDKYTPDFGRPAEDPEFMLRLCLLQYLYGDSDRGVIENARMNLGYKYFLGLAIDQEPPDDTIISVFRAKRLGEAKFRQIFEQIIQQCIDKGLVTGKKQIIDSTHINADMAVTSLTGLLKLCRYNVLRTIGKQKPKLAEKLGLSDLQMVKQDKFTRLEEGLDKEIEKSNSLLDEVTSGLKTHNLKITPELQKDLQLLEKAVADRREGATDRLISPVDTDARAGSKTHKHWVGYKGHMIIEEDSEIITAIETTKGNLNDGGQLKTLLTQQEQNLNIKPQELSGDKAYDSGANLEYLDNKQIIGNVSLSGNNNCRNVNLFTKNDFEYDAVNKVLTCPAGNIASQAGNDFTHTENARRLGWHFQFSRMKCSICELRPLCITSKSPVYGRSVHVSVYESLYKQMQERMESEEGKAAYRKRYKIEHKVADLARYCGMRRCRYRGLNKAKIHTFLAAIVSNVKRMTRLLCPPKGEVCLKPDNLPEMLVVAP